MYALLQENFVMKIKGVVRTFNLDLFMYLYALLHISIEHGRIICKFWI